jgi:predicted acyltransferase
LAGLLSVVPTTALVLVAATIANLLRSKEKSDAVKLKSLVAAGIALTAAGMAWNEVLPFNKTVWTPSYILLSAGLGSLLLALLFWILDLRKWMWWAFPLVVYGSNALVAYVGPVLLKLVVLQRVKIDFHGRRLSIADAWLHSFTDTLGRVPGGWAYTVSYMLAVWVVLLILYRMKWFVRV